MYKIQRIILMSYMLKNVLYVIYNKICLDQYAIFNTNIPLHCCYII